MCLSITLHGCTEFGWQNTWESDSWRPRHFRALDNQHLLANEDYQKIYPPHTPSETTFQSKTGQRTRKKGSWT